MDVGEVTIDVGALVGVDVLVWSVGILLVLKSDGLAGALVVDVPKGAVSGSRESERSSLEVPLVVSSCLLSSVFLFSSCWPGRLAVVLGVNGMPSVSRVGALRRVSSGVGVKATHTPGPWEHTHGRSHSLVQVYFSSFSIHNKKFCAAESAPCGMHEQIPMHPPALHGQKWPPNVGA